MEILKIYNSYRVDFIIKKCIQSQMAKSQLILKGLWVLDVGTGAGFLAESLSRLGANVHAIDSC